MTMPMPPVRLDDRSLLALMTASLWPAMVSSQIGSPRDDSVRIARELLEFVDQQIHAAATPENLTPFFDESCLGPGRAGRRVLDEDNPAQPAGSMPAMKVQDKINQDLLPESCFPFWTALRVGHMHDYVLVWTTNAIDNSPTEYGQRIVDALLALGGKRPPNAPKDAKPVVELVHYGWALDRRFLLAGEPLPDSGSWVKVYVHPGQPYLAPPHSAATLPNDLPEIVVSAEGADEPSVMDSDHLENACDQIDAALFSGDAFQLAGNAARLRWYMRRWSRELKSLRADPQQP